MSTKTASSESYKVIMLGSGGVGKSAITIQFIQGQFMEQYDPTIEDKYHKTIVVDGDPVSIDVVDTAGQEEYSLMSSHNIRGGDGFIVVFSITELDTFEDACAIHKKILEMKEVNSFPVVFAANKCDLEHDREVEKDKVEQFTKTSNNEFLVSMETSARSKINIDEAYEGIVRECRKYKEKAKAAAASRAQASPAPSAGGAPSKPTASAPSTKAAPAKKEKKKGGCTLL